MNSTQWTESQYLNERVEDQISWYDRRSKSNQCWYRFLTILEMLLALSIPLISIYLAETPSGRIILAIVGILIALVGGLLTLYDFNEHWIQYRSTCESLKHEKFLYLTRATPYNRKQPFELLVERIESLISKENSSWAQYVTQKKETKNNGN